MHPLKVVNSVSFATPSGYKSVQLRKGLLSPETLKSLKKELGDEQAPMLLLSNLNRNYDAKGLMKHIIEDFNVDINKHKNAPAIDLMNTLGIWVSDELDPKTGISRIICWNGKDGIADLKNGFNEHTFTEGIKNVCATVSLIHSLYPKKRSSTLVSVLLGTGPMNFKHDDVSKCILHAATQVFPTIQSFKQFILVEQDKDKVESFNKAMDDTLGRVNIRFANQPSKMQLNYVAHQILIRLSENFHAEKSELIRRVNETSSETINILKSQDEEINLNSWLVERWLMVGRDTSEAIVNASLSNKELDKWKAKNERIRSVLKEQNLSLNDSTSSTHYRDIEALGFSCFSLFNVVPDESLYSSELPNKVNTWFIQTLHMLRAYGNTAAHIQKTGRLPNGFSPEDVLLVASGVLRCIEYITKNGGAFNKESLHFEKAPKS